MKSAVGQLILAALLFGAALALWSVGQVELRAANAERAFVTLRYTEANQFDDIAQSLDWAGRVPGAGRTLAQDARERDGVVKYWGGRISVDPDAQTPATESDPALLLVTANAAYRAVQRAGGDRPTTLHRLDEVIKKYAEVLKSDPDDEDAAYNCEYVTRVRNALAKPDTKKAAAKAGEHAPAATATLEDVPTGPTIHGRPGAPPPGSKEQHFNTIVPMSPDERDDLPEAGTGKAKVRKG